MNPVSEMEISGSVRPLRRHGDAAFQELQVLGQGALVEDAQLIFAGRNVAMWNLPGNGGDHVPGSGHHGDDGAHGGMDIAEDAHDAGLSESHALGSARGIQANIERLAAEIGEGVVKDGIEIGEIHRAAHRNGQHVRREVLSCCFICSALGRGRPARAAPDGLEPEHHAGIVAVLADRGVPRVGELHLAADSVARGRAASAHKPALKPSAKKDKPTPDHSGC